jgi:hypothetical protein
VYNEGRKQKGFAFCSLTIIQWRWFFMLEGVDPEQKRVAKIAGMVIALLIVAIVVLPLMQQPVEDSANRIAEELTPPNESVETPVRIIEKEVVVPGPINVSDDVKSYSEQQVLKLIKNRDPDNNAHRYTKGDMRAATGAEFEEFLAALKNSKATTGFARATGTEQAVFWANSDASRKKIGAGYMVTLDDMGYDHCYALVLIMAGSKPAIAAVSATSSDPENDWFIWTSENTPGKEAYIATLTSG